MSRRPLFALIPAVVASALGLAAWSAHSRAPRAPSAAPAATALEATAVRPRPAAQKAVVTRYRISSAQHVVIDGEERASVLIEGVWTTSSRAGAPVEAQLAATKIDVRGGDAPSAADLAAPILLGSHDGVLDAMAFSDATPRAARGILTGLATTFQHSARPDARYTVEEEDLLGRYQAVYQRAPEGRLVRTRHRYTALRGARGLSAERASLMAPEERSELRFDDEGLVSARVAIKHTFSVGDGMAAVEMRLSATLAREDVATVDLPPAPELDLQAISDHLDRAAISRRNDEARVAGAKAPELVAKARRAAHLDRKNGDAQKHRSVAVKRLSSLVKIDAEAATVIADAIRNDPGDRESVGMLAGSLASADAPAATNALARLLDEPLPAEARSAVLMSLGVARAPTAESVSALSSALDGPRGADAALALGSQAGKLADDGAGEDAVNRLLERYAAAKTPEERRLYLDALANSGSRDALPVMLAALQDQDFGIARTAAYGLRFIPGDDVDDLLLSLIQSGSTVTVEAIQAAAFRAPAVWKPRLEAAKVQFDGQKRILDTIAAVLVRWANLPSSSKL
jgi:hypothetical protein